MKYQGKLTNWDDKKGFGFVEPNGGGNSAFVHIKSFKKRSKRPTEGDLIIYEQTKDARGKFKAINVSLVIDRKLNKAAYQKPRKFGYFIAAIFCIVLATVTYLKLIPIEVMYLYVAASFIAFIVYALDKSSAKNGRWRTPESHLHLLSLLGGWPGAFYAQNKLKHKSSKRAFKNMYWLTVTANIGALVWLLGAQGQQFLQSILG
ncbi:DUF1294 domain-containing protein [Catenovulum sp. SM1970]|uniref:DUF1294 domain-containing protein n=1 Tax=Marinifaba aquimaris TaxID=2741323 RepID=UPI001571A260|nr:DUF1294 domain-containing protein [Marinifaba aquimaris]NTS78207.1 DUF1294 domain-containing protein [Marinifaba aquimaris]